MYIRKLWCPKMLKAFNPFTDMISSTAQKHYSLIF